MVCVQGPEPDSTNAGGVSSPPHGGDHWVVPADLAACGAAVGAAVGAWGAGAAVAPGRSLSGLRAAAACLACS